MQSKRQARNKQKDNLSTDMRYAIARIVETSAELNHGKQRILKSMRNYYDSSFYYTLCGKLLCTAELFVIPGQIFLLVELQNKRLNGRDPPLMQKNTEQLHTRRSQTLDRRDHYAFSRALKILLQSTVL